MKPIFYLSAIIFLFISCQEQQDQAFLSKIHTGPGPEDILEDASHNRVLVSCNERRTGYASHGEIWQLPFGSDSSFILPRVNYPAGTPFFPHGFDLQTVNGELYLYVINHYQDADNTTAIDKFKVHTDNIEYINSFLDPLLISPNDLTVLTDGSFYFSNVNASPDLIDLITHPYSGSVVYGDGAGLFKKVDVGISYPNGLYNENGKLYVATSRNKALYKYDIQADGSLLNRAILNPIDGMDNITAAGDELIIAVHPDILKFVTLSLDPTGLSPGKTYAINKTTGASKLLFDTDGSMISGASTSLVIGEDLYMGQVFGDFLLKISHYQNRK